nr:CHASE domain-containing protein [Alkalilimnicola ehrlichii]
MLAWLVLVLGVALSIVGWYWTSQLDQQQIESRFQFRANDITTALTDRMSTYKQVLRGGAGLFDTGAEVDLDAWARYVHRQRLRRNFPGIQGVGFAALVPAAQLEEHVLRERQQGRHDYAVWPEGVRTFYGPIVYLEPDDWRNRRAIGYDMFSDPVRREAMVRAADTGDSALSGRVTLVQETDEDIQAGFLLYLPVYAGGGVPDTVEQRRRDLIGWIYSPFRMNDLMQGLLGATRSEVRLRIYDGLGRSEQTLMFDSHPERNDRALAGLSRTSALLIDGHRWTVELTALPEFAQAGWWRPGLVLTAGFILTLSVFALIWSMASTRARAVSLAASMTTALRQSEERFRVALEDSNIAVFSQDAELRYTWIFNPGHGVDPNRVIGKTDYQLAIPPKLVELKENVLREGVGLHQEVEASLFGQKYVFAVTLEPLRDNGDIVGLTAAAVDITSLKQAERKVKESEARFRTMFEHAAVGIMLTDCTQGDLIAVNPAFQQMLGYTETELRALPWRGFVAPESQVSLDSVVHALQSSSVNVYKRQEYYLRKQGERIVVSLTASLVWGTDGKPKYVLWMADDVSELRAAEERARRAYQELERRVHERTQELQHRTAELERSNAELEQFAYVASHDLQEPLRTVSSFAQLLERRYAHRLDAQAGEYLGYIVSGTSRMRAMILDLLALSRVGAWPPPPSSVDLNQVVEDVRGNLHQAAEESSAKIHFAPLPTIIGDYGELVQLFQNLLANAIKFRSERPPRIDVGVVDDGPEWRFFVCDNGIGIEKEQLQRVFIIFHRLHHKVEAEGTGIGLAICKKSLPDMVAASGSNRPQVKAHAFGSLCLNSPKAVLAIATSPRSAERYRQDAMVTVNIGSMSIKRTVP